MLRLPFVAIFREVLIFFERYVTKITSLVVFEIYLSKEKKNNTSLKMGTKRFSAVSLILSVYIVMLLSAVLLSCLCWLFTLRCLTLHLSAAVLFTLTACIVMFAPLCLRCSPVLTLCFRILPVSPCCSPADDNCKHCDAHPPSVSINAVVVIGISQLYIRVPFKTDLKSFPHLPIHMLTLLIISTYVIFWFYMCMFMYDYPD